MGCVGGSGEIFQVALLSDRCNSVLLKDEFATLQTRLNPNLSRPERPGHVFWFTVPSSEVPWNRLDRWQENQELLRRVWKRWFTDYSSGLHSRTKWTQFRNNIELGK